MMFACLVVVTNGHYNQKLCESAKVALGHRLDFVLHSKSKLIDNLLSIRDIESAMQTASNIQWISINTISPSPAPPINIHAIIIIQIVDHI